MKTYQPLLVGDMIRIIAPSYSWRRGSTKRYIQAQQRLRDLGYAVSEGKHLHAAGRFGTAPITERLEDLHAAYADEQVKAILCLGGGWSANELLPGINWDLIGANPKPLIGFSDITVLVNAIYAKTEQIGLLGPTLSSFGGRDCWQYTLDCLHKVLSGTAELTFTRSTKWSDGKISKTRPWRIIQPGIAQGRLLGGNIGTYYLLQGTPYTPRFEGKIILAIEDDNEAGALTAQEFDRRLESLLQQPGVIASVNAVLVGRFQRSSKVSRADITDILLRKFSSTIPIVADVDFGHTKPLLTLPIGGMLEVDAAKRQATIKLLEY
jgi:muramoyltetrapeptide carboxypeptidase